MMDAWDRETPTVRAPEPAEVYEIRSSSEVDEILYRYSVGDSDAALRGAEPLLGRVPVVIQSRALFAAMQIGAAEEHLLHLVDGRSVAEVVSASGLPVHEAMRGLCELLDARVLALR